MTKSIQVYVPATIGNVGPGFDVLGLAIEGLGDTFELTMVKNKEDAKISISGRDAELIPVDPKKNAATIAAAYLSKKLNHPCYVSINCKRELPVSGGMGSSAAAAVAGAFGLSTLLKSTNQELILESALYAESLIAGEHLDNISPCLFGGLTASYGVKPPKVIKIPTSHKWWIGLYTPPIKIETSKARMVLLEKLETKIWTQQMANSIALCEALRSGDELLCKESLIDLYSEPSRACLIPRYHDLIKAALNSGAIGACISGAGPTIFTISAAKETSINACKEMELIGGAGIVHVGKIDEDGARLI